MRPERCAAQLLLDYAGIGDMVGGLTENTSDLADALEQRPDALPAFKVALPELSACRRRLLTLAAAIGRLERRIET